MSAATVVTESNSSQIENSSGNNNTNCRRLKKEWTKLAKQKSRLVFLLKCRRNDISPRFLVDRVGHLLKKYKLGPCLVKKQAESLDKLIKKSLLNMEISTCSKQIEEITQVIISLAQGLQSLLSDEEIVSTNLKMKRNYEFHLKSSNMQLYRKFSKLMETQDHIDHIQYDESFIKNFSDVEIPPEVLTILSLGPKFAIQPTEAPVLEVATDVELIISKKIPEEKKRQARGDALYTLTKFSKQNQKLLKIDKFLQKAAKTARIFLKNNPNLWCRTPTKVE